MKTKVVLENGSNWKSLDDLKRSIDFARSVGCLWKGQLWLTPHFVRKSNKNYKTYEKYEVPQDWVHKLKADDVFWTPFDVESLMFLKEEIFPTHYKIASLDSDQKDLIQLVACSNRPAFISCGVYGLESIRRVVKWYGDKGNLFNLTLMHSINEYPNTDSHLGYLKDRINATRTIPWGFSFNGNNPLIPALAVTLGATAIEAHFKMPNIVGTPDAPHSMTKQQVLQMLEFIKTAESNMGNSERPLPCELPHIKAGQRKSNGKR